MRRTFTLNNIYNQWSLVGLGLTTLAAMTWWVVPTVGYANWIGAILMMIPAGQFAWAVYKKPLPMEQPYAVNVYERILRWWEDFSRPAVIGEFEGKRVLERWHFFDFRTIYDGRGYAIATEQTINWSDTDEDWRPGMPEDKQVIVTPANSGERLPWLARWRSPKLA